MSVCQDCHEREAVVHLTEVSGDTVSTLHLCGKCASARGMVVEEPAATPLGSFLATLGKGGSALAAAATVGESCPGCGATLADFRASGRTGCPACWVTFERPLRDLVRRLHGATRHTGRRYEDPAVTADPMRAVAHERAKLRDALRQAIESEQFEVAAELRDRLRALEES